MSTTYHITTSDRHMHHIKGLSAIEAITKALERNRGCTVLECFAGNVDLSANLEVGRITYEIPPHKALPPRPDEP